MAGLYRNLLLLSLVMYVVCMLVSLADAATIDDRFVRERRSFGGPGSPAKLPPGLHWIGDAASIEDRSLRKRRGIHDNVRLSVEENVKGI